MITFLLYDPNISEYFLWNIPGEVHDKMGPQAPAGCPTSSPVSDWAVSGDQWRQRM